MGASRGRAMEERLLENLGSRWHRATQLPLNSIISQFHIPNIAWSPVIHVDVKTWNERPSTELPAILELTNSCSRRSVLSRSVLLSLSSTFYRNLRGLLCLLATLCSLGIWYFVLFVRWLIDPHSVNVTMADSFLCSQNALYPQSSNS